MHFGGQRQPLTDAQRQYVAHAQRTEESTVRGLQVNVEPIASHTSLTAAYVNLLLAKRRDDGRQWLRACLDAHTQPPQQDVVYPVIDGLLAQLRQDRKNFEGQCALLAPAYETRDAGTMDLDDNAGVQLNTETFACACWNPHWRKSLAAVRAVVLANPRRADLWYGRREASTWSPVLLASELAARCCPGDDHCCRRRPACRSWRFCASSAAKPSCSILVTSTLCRTDLDSSFLGWPALVKASAGKHSAHPPSICRTLSICGLEGPLAELASNSVTCSVSTRQRSSLIVSWSVLPGVSADTCSETCSDGPPPSSPAA